jgi:hypothetical protein
MNAAKIAELANEDGISAVARELGCTIKQASDIAALARRAVRAGRNLNPIDLPYGTVAAAKAVHPAGRIGHAFTDAEVADMADAIVPRALVGLSAEEHYEYQRAEQDRLRRERNAANGHPELDPRLREHIRSTSR